MCGYALDEDDEAALVGMQNLDMCRGGDGEGQIRLAPAFLGVGDSAPRSGVTSMQKLLSSASSYKASLGVVDSAPRSGVTSIKKLFSSASDRGGTLEKGERAFPFRPCLTISFVATFNHLLGWRTISLSLDLSQGQPLVRNHANATSMINSTSGPANL